MPGAELTELTDIKVVRQDGVRTPASGFPILLMKSAACVCGEINSRHCPVHQNAAKDADGDYDGDTDCGCPPDCNCRSGDVGKARNEVGGINEKPDIDKAEHVLQILAQLIASEAAEMAGGEFDEVYGIQQLVECAWLMSCFRDGEMWGDGDDGDMMKSVDGIVFKASRKFSSDERKRLASEGKALEDGSYPIPDEDALRRAAILARSGHGDVAAAKRLIARRAKELGVKNPLADNDAKKAADDLSQVRTADSDLPDEGMPEAGTPAEGVTKTSEGDQPEDGDTVANQIEKAVAEATKADRERMEALEAEVAKMRATPIPGGPMLTATAAQRDMRGKTELLAKASYHERLAERVGDRELARYHREEARKAREATAS